MKTQYYRAAVNGQTFCKGTFEECVTWLNTNGTQYDDGFWDVPMYILDTQEVQTLRGGIIEIPKSVFMQMHDGERLGEGSFYNSLKQCFYDADGKNRKRLISTFREFFGFDTELYFGITV